MQLLIVMNNLNRFKKVNINESNPFSLISSRRCLREGGGATVQFHAPPPGPVCLIRGTIEKIPKSDVIYVF